MKILARLFAIILLTVGIAARPAYAQIDVGGNSYITPYPEGDIYRLQVYGDAFAEGLLGGLSAALGSEARLEINKKNRWLNGLRNDVEDELKAIDANRDPMHIAVVMLGINDRYSIRVSARDRFAIGTDEWREEYGRRADRLIKTLKKRGAAVYWIGQPIMRRAEANEPAQVMNDVVRERAYLNGVKYIDITAHFANETGGYTAYGPDLAGKQRLVRESDGILFTWAGYRKLAHFVEREIKRDLAQARNDRSIPLAGAETEQSRIAAQRAREEAAWKGTVTQNRSAAQKGEGRRQSGSLYDRFGEQKADNGRIALKTVGTSGREEIVTLDLPRPAIPAAVIQLITRKDNGDRPSQMGDVLADEVGGGLVVLSSVTPANIGSGPARRVIPGQPYYQVWIKGERLAPKPGRADDFSWPRIDPEIAVQTPRRPQTQAPLKSSPRS